MAVKAAGAPLKFSEIQAEFGGSDPISLSEYYRGGAYTPDGPSQNSAIASNGPINVLDFYGSAKVFVLTQVISANTQNYNLRAVAIAAGWNELVPLDATVTVNAGVIVGSSTTSNPAFTLGSSAYPAGSVLRLVNNGTIVGAGGKGGDGSANNAGAGGVAINATASALSITNNGIIGGGGGGGGASASYVQNVSTDNRTPDNQTFGGSGGGGGAGNNAGAGGGAGAGSYPQYNGSAGGAGSTTSGGGGASAGGALGAAGGNSSYPGAAGGPVSTGSSNITWVVAGDRRGAIT